MLMTDAAPHSHRTSQVAIVERPETHDPKCDTCGRSMADVRAERNARAAHRRTGRGSQSAAVLARWANR